MKRWLLCLALASCGKKPAMPVSPMVTPATPITNFTVALGDEQNVIPPATPGLLYVNDEHITYQRQADGTFKLWISDGATFGFTSPDLLSLTSMLIASGVPQPVLAPSGSGTTAFDADYAGAGSVFTATKGDLLMIYHAENHLFGSVHSNGSTFYASIGLARSSDGGVTWQREGQIVAGEDPQLATQTMGGAGAATPSVLTNAGYLYMIFREIDRESAVTGMALARAEVSGDGGAGTWQKLNDGSFSTAGLGGAFTPLTITLDPTEEADRRQPSISFNNYLHLFLLTIVGNGGIYLATSPDLQTWSAGQVILAAPVPDGKVTPSTAPYNWYPTLVSPLEASEVTTDQNGFLYYAKGANDGTSHHTMYRRSFTLSAQ